MAPWWSLGAERFKSSYCTESDRHGAHQYSANLNQLPEVVGRTVHYRDVGSSAREGGLGDYYLGGCVMLLAEALARRAEAQDRLNKLQGRLNAVARVQEGDTPAEDPQTLLSEAVQLLEEIEVLVRRINHTNANTQFDESMTLTDAIARRDGFLRARRMYTSVADAAAIRGDRYNRSEIKFVPTLDVGELRRNADQMSKDFRALDMKIQQLNWTTELL